MINELNFILSAIVPVSNSGVIAANINWNLTNKTPGIVGAYCSNGASDGTPLRDSKGNVTSHLSGLFFRTSKFLQNGLKLVFVFDGKAPDLKARESARRAGLKEEAAKKFEEATLQKEKAESSLINSNEKQMLIEMGEQKSFLEDKIRCLEMNIDKD